MKRSLVPVISNEEMKIRRELEMDIERDLEQEIKDGIYHLALRLHRLYQHQEERNKRETSDQSAATKYIHQETRNKMLSEVNISIKLDGGTKIEIKEKKKEAPCRPRSSRSEQNRSFQGMIQTKRFDWARSLRSSGLAPAMAITRRNERSLQGRTLSNCHAGQCLNLNPENNSRRNLTGQQKINAGLEYKILELGWKC